MIIRNRKQLYKISKLPKIIKVTKPVITFFRLFTTNLNRVVVKFDNIFILVGNGPAIRITDCGWINLSPDSKLVYINKRYNELLSTHLKKHTKKDRWKTNPVNGLMNAKKVK